MNDQLVEIFLNEAQELLSDLEKALLKLESNPQDEEGISIVFRAMHTLKGSSGMFGFDAVNTITHHLESIYQDIRDGRRTMSAPVLEVTFKTVDHLRYLMNDAKLENELLRDSHNHLMNEIIVLNNQDADAAWKTQRIETEENENSKVYYVYLLPNAKLLKNGNNTLYLVEDLLALGKGLAFPFFKDLPVLNEIAAENSYTGFEVIIYTTKSPADIQEVFMFVEGECEVLIKELNNVTDFKIEAGIAEPLHWKDSTNAKGYEEIQKLLADPKQGKLEQINKTIQKKHENASSIRVSAERLSDLMNLVSELVTTQARLSLYASLDTDKINNFNELTSIAENIEKITRRLRDNAFTMSLIPLETLVVRFQRLFRDLSVELKKNIQFKTEGTDTAIDKSIIEKLTDPLLHLLRNAMDHGIENPEERIKKGKAAEGTVLLKSYYSGANVVIEISDDGAGINLYKVKEQAIAKGLLESNTHPSEKELLDLIFLPGFSTAKQVSSISGRGVGMDVVKQNINNIQGEIEVKTSSEGTTFIITIPLTLSIMDGLLVQIGNTDFILPLASVIKCYGIETAILEKTFNNWITLDDERTSFFFLRENFGIEENKPRLSQVVKVPFNGTEIGLVVDKIEGEYQAVLKPLGQFYHGQDEFSGATILGNGSVALVIDPAKLIKKLSIEYKSDIV